MNDLRNTLAAGLAPERLMLAVSTAVTRKALEAQRQEGAAVIALLDSAAVPAAASLAADPDRGRIVDLYA